MRAIVRDAGSAAALLPPTCEIFAAPDLADPAAAQDAAAGLDAIIHTASVFRRCDDMETELVQPNIALVQHMVRACAATGASRPARRALVFCRTRSRAQTHACPSERVQERGWF